MNFTLISCFGTIFISSENVSTVPKMHQMHKRPPVSRGVRKTVNGAHQCGCAPFLYAIMTYGTVAAAPLALPLGELSPKVTERVLQAFLNGDINLCAHAAKIHINISVGKTQNLQSKCCQKYGHVFPSQSAAPTALPKGEPSSARNALHRTVHRSAPSLSVR